LAGGGLRTPSRVYASLFLLWRLCVHIPLVEGDVHKQHCALGRKKEEQKKLLFFFKRKKMQLELKLNLHSLILAKWN